MEHQKLICERGYKQENDCNFPVGRQVCPHYEPHYVTKGHLCIKENCGWAIKEVKCVEIKEKEAKMQDEFDHKQEAWNDCLDDQKDDNISEEEEDGREN